MLSKKPDFYLASQSPRRKMLLQQLGCFFEVLSGEIDEQVRAGETPECYVGRMSQEKVEQEFGKLKKAGELNRPVLAADTAVVVEGKILGKPCDRENALWMLKMLSGNTHHVMTSVHMKNQEQMREKVSVTEVEFITIPLPMAEAYWDTGEPEDKAGAYAIQGYGAAFVHRITGSYSGVAGLPLCETVEIFQQFRIPFWNQGFMHE